MSSGEVVLVHEVADFRRDQPAWRLYMLANVVSGLCEALDWQNSFGVSDEYESFCRETAWGALHFTLAQTAPMSAERVALRLQAVLRFWEPLQSVRYLFKRLNVVLSLEELLIASCDWAMDAWTSMDDGPVRARLQDAAGLMARATREDSIKAILKQWPRALVQAVKVKHKDVLTDPVLLRRRIEMLSPEAFERVSGACTVDLLGQVYAWDAELEK